MAEADDSDDHIVPFPRGSEENRVDISGDLINKERDEEITIVKASKQRKTVSSSKLDGVKQERYSECDKTEILLGAGHSVGSWNKSLANESKDSRDKPAKFDSCSQIFQDLDDDKERDLVGYDWGNVGSFYDLDRFFSNGDPEFGCTSLGNADELWSSSMDYCLASGVPSTSEQCGKTEDMIDQAQPFSLGYRNTNDLTCCVPQNKHVTMNHLRHAEFKNNLFVENKIARDMVSKALQVNANLDTRNVLVPTELSDKLDVQLRLCIRDSLCRLARSATQRQYTTDTGNTKKRSGDYLKYLPEEDTNTDKRFAGTPEGETDTNPIDRTVAHLLFHRSFEFSENLKKAESPASAKILQERTSTNLLTMPRGILAENYNSMETRSDVVMRDLVRAEVEMSKSSTCVNMSEYALNCEEVQKEVTEV